jgi:hypothetical protein
MLQEPRQYTFYARRVGRADTEDGSEATYMSTRNVCARTRPAWIALLRFNKATVTRVTFLVEHLRTTGCHENKHQ